MFIRRERGGTGTGCLFQFTYCELYSVECLALNYTQKKKFSQYISFLIKLTILDLSLSICIHELYYRYLTCIIFLCVVLYQPISKYTMCMCCSKPAGLFSHILFDVEKELFLLHNPVKIQC